MSLPGTAKLWPGNMYAMVLAEVPVFPASVNFVCKNPFRISAEPPSVFLYNGYELVGFAFVVGIKAQTIDKRVAVYNADGHFGTEFRWCFGFPADDWPDPRLGEAYNTVCSRVRFRIKHLFLLSVKGYDGDQPFSLYAVQAFKPILKRVSLDIVQVPADTAQLVAEFLADLFRRFPAALVELKETAACYLPVSARFSFLPFTDPYRPQ